MTRSDIENALAFASFVALEAVSQLFRTEEMTFSFGDSWEKGLRGVDRLVGGPLLPLHGCEQGVPL